MAEYGMTEWTNCVFYYANFSMLGIFKLVFNQNIQVRSSCTHPFPDLSQIWHASAD